MKGNAHLLIGSVASVALIVTDSLGTYGTQPENFIENTIFSTAMLIGSVLPDIDNKNSMLGKPCFFLRFMQGTYDHRKYITHTLLFPFLLVAFLYYMFPGMIPTIFLVGLLIGYVLHLICDMITPQGVRMLYPFSKKYFKIKI